MPPEIGSGGQKDHANELDRRELDMTPDERRELEEKIMVADLAQKESAIKLADRQFRWETFKALAAIIAAVAVISGTVIALESYLQPASRQPMFPPGTVISIPPASGQNR